MCITDCHCLLTSPRCIHCFSCHHNCCCSRTLSPLRTSLNKTSSIEKFNNNYSSNISQLDTTIFQRNNLTPERKNKFISSVDQEVKKVSPNLSLRLSPERRFSPRRESPLRESMIRTSSPERQFSSIRTYSPYRHCSPIRTCSPHRHCSPIRTCSPHRHCSPIRCHTACCVCHCYPCLCCKIAYENGERVFLNYLRDMMSVESQIERSKIDLALRADFNVEDAYRIFENNGRGFITESDLKYGLSLLDIYATHSDIRLLMRRIDIHRTGTINYADFFDLVTPFDKDYRTMVERRTPSSYSSQYNKQDVFLLGTKLTLQSLLRLIISSENKLENTKYGLREAREQLKNIFDDITRGCCTFSDMDLSSYLRIKGVYVTEQECGLGFIHLNRNRNGKVEYWELSDDMNTLL